MALLRSCSGMAITATRTEPAKTADQNLYKAFYAGDTYQVTRKITLNLGLRVDLQGDWTERFNRIVAFNPTETSQSGPRRNAKSERCV